MKFLPSAALRSPLGRRLILAIVMASSAITLVLTALDMGRRYRHEMSGVEETFRQFENVHLKALALSAWSTDEHGLRLQVEGIKALPNVERIAVRDDGRELAGTGARASRYVVERRYSLTHLHRGQPLEVGALTLVVGLDPIYRGLLAEVATVLAGNAVKTFLVALFALAFFHRLVIRHLLDIAQHVRTLDLRRPGEALRLERPMPARPDELDTVARAIDAMERDNRQALASLAESEARHSESGARLRALSQRLLAVQEEERAAIARELHDEIGQGLTAMKINVRSVARQLDGERRAKIEACAGIIDHTLAQMRNLSLDLRPPQLDRLGLGAALRAYLARLFPDAAPRVTVEVPPDEATLPRALATTCFRIAQEAATNAARHARATNLTVRLERNGAQLELEIADDGAGFDVAAEIALREGRSMGLASMEERARLAGGSLRIDTRPGGGTRVRALLPLEAEKPAERPGCPVFPADVAAARP